MTISDLKTLHAYNHAHNLRDPLNSNMVRGLGETLAIAVAICLLGCVVVWWVAT
jgi:hypothetical protein